MDPYDPLRERTNGLPDSATSQRMLNNRDWAPPGGTSHNEHRRLSDTLDRDFRWALDTMSERIPGLSGRFLDQFGVASQPVWLQWDTDADGGYWVSCGVEHCGCWPPEALRTHATVHYLTEDNGRGSYPPDQRNRPATAACWPRWPSRRSESMPNRSALRSAHDQRRPSRDSGRLHRRAGPPGRDRPHRRRRRRAPQRHAPTADCGIA